jgi:alpha-tubulin suppressor-like RCC1 family protein
MPDSTVRCWGDDGSGQLGDGTFGGYSATPAPVTGLTNVAVIDAGTYGTCAILKDGTVRCWGANSEGQLGDNSQTDRAAPVTVTGLTDAVAVDMFNGHTCAARRDGSVRCWGDNAKGQIGAAGVGTAVLTPRTIPGVSGAHGVAVGHTESCAISRSNGAVQCWGEGLLGDAAVTTSTTPVTAVGLTGVLELQFGGLHACARTTRSEVWCWGDAALIGASQYSGNPRAVPSVTAVGLGVSFYETVVVEPAGTMKSWQSVTPQPIPGVTNVAAVSNIAQNRCIVLRDGTVACGKADPAPVAGLDLF